MLVHVIKKHNFMYRKLRGALNLQVSNARRHEYFKATISELIFGHLVVTFIQEEKNKESRGQEKNKTDIFEQSLTQAQLPCEESKMALCPITSLPTDSKR